MSLLDLKRAPKSPIIPSLVSANAEINRWVKQHQRQEFLDSAQGHFRLQTRLEQLPHPDDTQAPLFKLHVSLLTEIDAAHLVQVGAFDPVRDQRLLDRLGEDTLTMSMRERVLEATSIEQMRSKLADELANISKALKKTDLNPMRRRLVGEWIDRKSTFRGFGNPEAEAKIALDV